MTKQNIIKLFDTIIEPKLKWSINSLNLLKNVEVTQEKVLIELDLVTTDEVLKKTFKEQLISSLKESINKEIEVNIGSASISSHGIEGIDKIIMVASGKGGVGKSTVSVNLAAALSKMGHSVGLLDADIYGPSIPTMLGCYDKPKVLQNENLKPIDIHNIKFISIGSLVQRDKAIDWRANLASGTIVQFINQTDWGKLDFLVIDMPPGTGDIHLTMASKLKPNGVIVVTTPQEVVLEDVTRSIDLIKQKLIPIVGIVENMSYMECEECGHHNHPFSSSKNKKISDIEILAHLPLTSTISQSCDDGTPLVFQDENSSISQIYLQLAKKVEEF